MLVISRKKAQKFIIGDDITIIILSVGRNQVRFGIDAPKDVIVHHRQDLISAGEFKKPEGKTKHE